MHVSFLIFNLILTFNFCSCQTGTNLKDLFTFLFTTNSYDKNARPNTDQSVPTSVTLDFYLAGISSLDEITESLTTTGYLQIIWTDDFLTWTPSAYGNIAEIHYSQDNVWKPAVTLRNGFSKMQELGSTFITVHIDNSGTVTWLPYETFQTKCSIDTTYFPFDKQTCDLVFVCWGTKPTQVNMTTGTYGAQLFDDFSSNGEWSVTNLKSNVDSDVDDVEVAFSFTLERKSGFFVLNIMMPVVILSVLNVFIFVIPCDGGERISYAITVWLAFAVFLTIVGSILPRSSSTTSITEVYLFLMIIIGTFCVLVSAVEIRLIGCTNEESKIPQVAIRMVKFLKKKRKTNAIDSKEKDNNIKLEVDHKNDSSKESRHTCWNEEPSVSWKDVVSAVDFILFWFCLALTFLITLIIFCILAAN